MTGPMHIRESDRGPVLLIRLGDKDLHVECGKSFIPVVVKINESIATTKTIYQCGCPLAFNVMP